MTTEAKKTTWKGPRLPTMQEKKRRRLEVRRSKKSNRGKYRG